jgi:MFS family permease
VAIPRAPEDAAGVRQRVLGLLPAIFLGAIDTSIVPVALLTIGDDLGDLALLPWVVAGYLVAGAVATPVYGKLSDLHGRRRMLLIALAVTVAGSVLCALAPSMSILVGARVLQGLGSGVLFALAQAAAADVIAGPERGRYQAYFSGVFATAALAAPLLGGFLTQHFSWRAVFWVNLPLAAYAAWRVHAVVARTAAARRDARIDWLGAGLLAAGLAVLLIAMARIGQGAAWHGAWSLGLVCAGVLLLGAWVRREADAPEPIVPLSLFGNRTVLASAVVTGLNFFVLIGATVLLPLSMQGLGGARPDEVAIRLVALTLATPAGAFTGGRWMLRGGRIGLISALGSALASLALVALALASAPGRIAPIAAMVPLGFGLGLTLPVVIVAAQAAVGPALTGVVTALVSFFRSLGGVIGTAVLTSVALGVAGGAQLASAPPDALARGFGLAFAVAAVVAGLAALISLRIAPPAHRDPTARR